MRTASESLKVAKRSRFQTAQAPRSLRFRPQMESKTFAFAFGMASGHINPSLPLARRLVALGHKVHYLSREQMRSAIEDTGASFWNELEAFST